MLTSDLLVKKISKGKIEPIYALLDQDNLEIARSVIGVFQEHVGRTYDELIEELEGIEEINYRLIRRMAQILEREDAFDKIGRLSIQLLPGRRSLRNPGDLLPIWKRGRGFLIRLSESYQSSLMTWKRLFQLG